MVHKNNLSEDAKQQIKNAFKSIEEKSSLKVVEIKGFDGVRTRLHMIWSSKDNQANKYFDYFEKKMIGDIKKKDGIFYEDCIKKRAEAYYEQLKEWRMTKLKKIIKELNKPESILSEYDKEIESIEKEIEDLGKRMDNLSDVRKTLVSLLDLTEV